VGDIVEIPDPVQEPGQKEFGLEGSEPEDGILDPNSLQTIPRPPSPVEHGPAAAVEAATPTKTAAGDAGPKKVICMARAMYSYTARSVEELSFHERDEIRIFEKMDDNWWSGELAGVPGFIAAAYVEEVPATKSVRRHRRQAERPMWFVGRQDREQLKEAMSKSVPGDYLVRESKNDRACPKLAVPISCSTSLPSCTPCSSASRSSFPLSPRHS
jgi:hypothetical protein